MISGYLIEIKFYKNEELISTEYMVAREIGRMSQEFQLEGFDRISKDANPIVGGLYADEGMSSDSAELMLDSDDSIVWEGVQL